MRRRSGDLGSRSRMDRRAGAVAAASQAHAVRRPSPGWTGPHDLHSRDAGVARRAAGRRRIGSPAMTATFLEIVDLASERLGGSVVAANDEFFAPKERLVDPSAPVWIEGKYTERGKWMDGWETRRRRDGGDYDWCIVRLGVRAVVRGFDVETTFFKGNYPESCAIDVCDASALATVDALSRATWREIVRRTTLAGDSHNLLAASDDARATHVRLRIFPDGGVARFRVHGEVAPDWDRLRQRGDVDLAAVEHGGLVVACSDMFFGSRHNLILPGEASHMADGWETKRRRGPGHDWTIVRLGTAGAIRR